MVGYRHQYSRELELFSFASSNELFQLINQLTQKKRNSSSCITDQANLSVNTGVDASLHPNNHYQILHSSFNLNICYHHHINPKYGITKRLIQLT